ncbi:MAG: lipopolysaccharide heptosyltransferase II [Vulcanimicrobiaceae bacterium]
MSRALLVAAGGGLGDSLVASLCIDALRERYDAVDAVVQPTHVDAFVHGSGVDEIFSTMLPFAELARKLRAKCYDAAVVTWATARTARIAFASGAPRRVGQARRTYAPLFTDRVVVRSERGDTSSHWSEILLDYPRALGCTTALQAPRFELNDFERDEADRLLRSRRVVGDYVLVHPTCAATPHRPHWPLDRWVEIVRAIGSRYGVPVLVTGTRLDRPIAAELAARSGAIDVAGRTSVGGFAALARRSRGFVVMHSGPMHVAAAVGTPTVAVFPLRADFPQRWRPLGERVELVCGTYPCPPGRAHRMETCATFDCIAALDVGRTMSALADVLERPRASHRAGIVARTAGPSCGEPNRSGDAGT